MPHFTNTIISYSYSNFIFRHRNKYTQYIKTDCMATPYGNILKDFHLEKISLRNRKSAQKYLHTQSENHSYPQNSQPTTRAPTERYFQHRTQLLLNCWSMSACSLCSREWDLVPGLPPGGTGRGGEAERSLSWCAESAIHKHRTQTGERRNLRREQPAALWPITQLEHAPSGHPHIVRSTERC